MPGFMPFSTREESVQHRQQDGHEFESQERYHSMQSMEDTGGTGSQKKPSKHHHLLTIHDLNEKFVRSNLVYIFLGAVLYVGIGVAIYHNMMKWDRLECLYFLTTTLLTIGYGDLVPISERQRIFTAFYILLGIVICGSALGSVSAFMQAHQEKMAKKRSLRALVRMKDSNSSLSTRNVVVENNPMRASEDRDRDSTGSNSDAHGSSNMNASGKSANRRRSLLQLAMSFSAEPTPKQSLQEMRDASISVYTDDYNALVRSSIVDVLIIFGVLIFGMIVMSSVEGWSAGEAFYWSVVTIMTVGYGDLVPTSTDGKWFTIFFALFGCAFVAKSLTDFAKFPLLARMLSNELTVINQFATHDSLTPELLQQIFNNELHELIPDLKRNTNEMSKAEFVMVLLQMMNKVEEKDIMLAAKVFDDLDSKRKGYFSLEDMQEQVQSARVRAATMAEQQLLQSQRDSMKEESTLHRIQKTISQDVLDPMLSPLVSIRSSFRSNKPVVAGTEGGGSRKRSETVANPQSIALSTTRYTPPTPSQTNTRPIQLSPLQSPSATGRTQSTSLPTESIYRSQSSIATVASPVTTTAPGAATAGQTGNPSSNKSKPASTLSALGFASVDDDTML